MTEPENYPEMPVEDPGSQNADVINLANANLKCVEARTVRLNQCTVTQLTAETVDFNNGAAQTVTGQTIKFSNGAVLVSHAGSLALSNGSVGVASVQQGTVNGNVGVLIGQNASLGDGQTGLMITNDVRAEKIKTLVLIARETHGPVETIVDQRGVALFGAAVGISLGLVFSLFRFFKHS